MNRSKLTTRGLLLLLPLLLGACMLTGQPAPLSILAPQVEIRPESGRQAVDWSLQIQRPVADQMRDSDRVLVRRTPSRLQVYGGAAWLDSAPEMLQSIMVKSFADAEVLAGVGRAGGIRTRYGLATEVRHFEAVDDGSPDLKVEVVLQAALIFQRSARSVATRTFRHEARADGKSADALVEATEVVLAELMRELIDWVLVEGAAADSRRESLQESDPERRWRQP